MKLFVDKRITSKDQEFFVKKYAFEWELPISSSESVFVYMTVDQNDGRVAVMTCLGHLLDGLEIAVQRNWKTIATTFPTLARLVDNTAENRFGEGIVSEEKDFDDGEYKWFITMLVKHHDLRIPPVWVNVVDDKTRDGANMIVEKSFQLIEELNGTQSNLFSCGGHKLFEGVVSGFKEAAIKSLINVFFQR